MNYKSIVAIAILAFTPMTACGELSDNPPSVDTDAVAEDVRQSVDGMVAAFLRRDVEGATESFADDYVGMFHGQPNVVGKAAEVEVTKTQMADPALGLTLSNVAVDVAKAADMAIFTATYAYDFTDPETMTPTTETGNWVLIYKRQADGTMKVTTGIVTDTPPS